MTLQYEQRREDVEAASRMISGKLKFFLCGCWLVLVIANVPTIRASMESGQTFFESLHTNAGSLSIVIAVGIFFLFLYWLQPKLAARRMILRSVEWRLSNEGVHVQSEVASSDLSWKAFIKFREGRKVFLLYVQKGQGQFIPKRILSEAQLIDLRDILSAHIKKA